MRMTNALDNDCRHVGAEQTVAFIRDNLRNTARILDVGCGEGYVALGLCSAGFDVKAIDNNPEAVYATIKKGVNVQLVDLLNFHTTEYYDAIVMSRTLHHINPLSDAIEKARLLLNDGGLLIIEDFGAELADEGTATWFYGYKACIEARRGILKARGPSLENGNIPQDCLGSWLRYHFQQHKLNQSQAMIEEIWKRFELVCNERQPYLYRYLIDDVTYLEGEEIMRFEKALCDIGTIQPIGIRVVGRKRG